MAELLLMKGATGSYIPVMDEDGVDRRCSIGGILRCTVRITRNARFFRKWWALVRFAFDHWEPGPVEHRWKKIIPKKNFNRFRKDLTILAGHYDAYYRLDGSVRVEAASIKWSKMEEPEFEELYSKTLDVILEKVLTRYDRVEAQTIADQLLLQYA